MPSTYSVSSHLLAEVFSTAKYTGFDNTTQSTIDQGTICRQARIPIADLCDYLCLVRDYTDDESIGLRLGEMIEPSCFNLIGHLVMSCPTIGVAMPLVNQFQQLVMDCSDSEYWIDESFCHFTWTPREKLGDGGKILIDLAMSAVRCFGVWATGIKDPFSRVYFQCGRPQDTAACCRIFGIPGEYNCDKNGFSYPISWCAHPIKSANEHLHPIIFEQAQRSLDSFRQDCPVVTRLADVLIKLLPLGYPSIERAGLEMNASGRTLQRHLKNKGTSYTEILQQVRLNRANFLLRNTRISLADVATAIGYREQSSFSNAYKSWVGMTPVQVRNEQSA